MFGGGFEAGASQFAGGFMPSPNAQAGSGSAQKKSYDQKIQTVRRVTIKQLSEGLAAGSPDSIFVDGKEISNVALVGKVINAREDNVTFTMLLDDGTGKITVKIFIQTDSTADMEQKRRAEIRDGIYVRVFGHLRSYNNECQIIAFSARPITDYNEVTYHMTQVIFQHLHLTKGDQNAANGIPAIAPKFEGAGAGVAAPAAGFGAAQGMNPIQKDVLAIFNAPDALNNEFGLTIPEVITRSNNHFTQQQVLGAITYLVEEGHLYSTIDDAHWKSCAC